MLVIASVACLAAVPQSIARASDPVDGNISPNPWFLQACSAQGAGSSTCIGQTVAAIDNARESEQMRQYPLVLPDNFVTLTAAEQTFVVIDLERVDRGLRPIVGLVSQLDAAALPGAIRHTDPAPGTRLLRSLRVRSYRTLWGSSFGPLATDYDWMYDDGYSDGGDPNVDCQYTDSTGCWAHRNAILTSFVGQRLLLAGIAMADDAQGMESITAIITAGGGPRPRLVYSWAEALRDGADAATG